MKKLLSLLSVLTVSGTAPLSEISCSCSNKNNEKKIKKDDKKDINKLNWGNLGIKKINRVKRNAIINNKSQHVFKTNGSNKPIEQQIKEEIIKLNPQLDIKNINITNVTENSAVITIVDFNGQKTINFKIEKNTSNNELFVGSPNPNNYSFDITKINNKEIIINKLSNDDFKLRKYILENDDINRELKSKVLELLLIDNTNLNEDSFKIEFINQTFPIDIKNKTIIELEANVIDKKNNKNNAKIKIKIKKWVYYNNEIKTINSPEKIIAKDVKNVTEEEIKNALLLKIYDKLKELNPEYTRIAEPINTPIIGFTMTSINFPIDLSSEKIINSFNLKFNIWHFFEPQGFSSISTTLNLKNFKLPAAQLI